MMLPIFIAVSVAPGSYFFWAEAVLANEAISRPASATDLAFKAWVYIIVLPDVLAAARASVAQFVMPSDKCTGSMHDCHGVASGHIMYSACAIPPCGMSHVSLL